MTDDPIEAPETPTADEFHKAHNKGIGSGWVLVITVPIIVLACALVVTWTNDSQDRQQAAYRRDQDNRQAQYRKQLEAKFSQALKISSSQFSFAINSNACGFEHYGRDAIARAEKARDDPRSDARVIAAAKATIAQTRSFLRTNAVKVPFDFDCATLPTKAPTP